MSDLVTRLAARAAGTRPTSRPRLQSRFTAGADLTEVVEEVVTPPPAPAPTSARPAAQPEQPPSPVVVRQTPHTHHTTVVHNHRTEHAAPPPETVVHQSFPRTEEVRVVREPAPPAEVRREVRVVEATPVVAEKSEHTQTVVDRTHERTTHEVVRSTVERRDTVVHTRVAEPRRPPAVPVTTPPQALPPLRPPAREEDVVRISIGRVEIRTNLVAPEPTRHQPEPAADRTISLADYLRGGHR